MNTDLYIIRHGQTEYNRLGILQGRTIDASLNELGKLQSQAFFNFYKDIPFERVVSSDLKRSIESVKHFIDLGIPHVIDERLTEFSWGTNEGIPLDDLVLNNYKNMLKSWYSGKLNARIPGGESGLELMTRVKSFKDSLSQVQDKLLLICTHGRTLKMLITQLLGREISYMEEISHSNTALFRLNMNLKSCEMILDNDTRHLPEELDQGSIWDK